MNNKSQDKVRKIKIFCSEQNNLASKLLALLIDWLNGDLRPSQDS